MKREIKVRSTLTSGQRKVYEKRLAVWDKRLAPLIQANRKCQELTATDYAVTINCTRLPGR